MALLLQRAVYNAKTIRGITSVFSLIRTKLTIDRYLLLFNTRFARGLLESHCKRPTKNININHIHTDNQATTLA